MSGRAPRMACNSDNPAIAAVKLSDGELTFMTGSASPEDFHSQLWHDGLKLAVLSLGERGCIAITERSEIDTTGAGDGSWQACFPASQTASKYLTTTMD
jgi:sugar/nucleoside kinase (ribokinase family)